jgi:hypothetical protein
MCDGGGGGGGDNGGGGSGGGGGGGAPLPPLRNALRGFSKAPLPPLLPPSPRRRELPCRGGDCGARASSSASSSPRLRLGGARSRGSSGPLAARCAGDARQPLRPPPNAGDAERDRAGGARSYEAPSPAPRIAAAARRQLIAAPILSAFLRACAPSRA